MIEERWLSCEEPYRMIRFLQAGRMASPRKCRLLMCGLSRFLWDELPDERSQSAVEAAEVFVDEPEGFDWMQRTAAQARQAHVELLSTFIAFRRAAGGKYRRHVKEAAARADASAVAAWAAASYSLGFWFYTVECGGDELGSYNEAAVVGSLLNRHHALVHEVFGNPFSPRRLDPACLEWGDRMAATLARSIYDTRRFEDMPILGDALEDAGCTEAALLDHLRGPGPHVRGCWALDLILGKE